ncbi:MAG: hypothetical protein IJO50_02640 [Clostridia bacterium]|nr:hypothetical protein [Clostridia bacterium]
MVCKKCKGEIDNKAVVCVHCGCKIKKAIYKRWWFWVILIAIVFAIAKSGGGGNDADINSTPTTGDAIGDAITYEPVDLGVMIDELKNNAMKAESNYQNKHIEFTGKISNFDSDGNYINVEPEHADEWNFDSAMCYIKNDEQRNVLIQKNIGDVVTICGKVKSVGEVLGYSVDIAEIK